MKKIFARLAVITFMLTLAQGGLVLAEDNQSYNLGTIGILTAAAGKVNLDESLGIETIDDTYHVLIKKGTSLPAEITQLP